MAAYSVGKRPHHLGVAKSGEVIGSAQPRFSVHAFKQACGFVLTKLLDGLRRISG
jgi:hypothetical protein